MTPCRRESPAAFYVHEDAKFQFSGEPIDEAALAPAFKRGLSPPHGGDWGSFSIRLPPAHWATPLINVGGKIRRSSTIQNAAPGRHLLFHRIVVQ